MEAHLEIERKYDAGEGLSVPDLVELPKVASVEHPGEWELVAVYFDTERLDLARAGVTLRRRSGGEDDGWHLKLPRGRGDREEIALPLRRGATNVPRALRSLVQVQARGRKLLPVATVRTRRVVHRLLSKSGSVLAELCDDSVTAETRNSDGSATTSAWREWEIELVQGRRKLLTATEGLVLAAGAQPASAQSKLARALGLPASNATALLEREPTKDGPAGVVVLRRLRDQFEALKAHDPEVRRDRPDAVHKMRVSTRRLRSALTTFEPLLDPEEAARMRAELKWLAEILGQARDAEVMRDRLTRMAAGDALEASQDPDSESTPPGADVADTLNSELGTRYRNAHADALRALSSARYYRLLDSLDALLEAPPWTSSAEAPARAVLRDLVRRDWRRTKKRAVAAEQAATPTELNADLHELRKAAKRLRYACEALAPVFGDGAEELADAAKQLQEVLGEHQDSVVSQELLRELAHDAGLAGEAALVLGRLHLLEEEQARRTGERLEAAWKRVSAKRRRRWLVS